jgi:hypothetical protein
MGGSLQQGRPHSGLGPDIPEPSEGIPVLEISGHRIPCGQQVVGNSVLGGLHHEYRLKKWRPEKGENPER